MGRPAGHPGGLEPRRPGRGRLHHGPGSGPGRLHRRERPGGAQVPLGAAGLVLRDGGKDFGAVRSRLGGMVWYQGKLIVTAQNGAGQDDSRRLRPAPPPEGGCGQRGDRQGARRLLRARLPVRAAGRRLVQPGGRHVRVGPRPGRTPVSVPCRWTAPRRRTAWSPPRRRRPTARSGPGSGGTRTAPSPAGRACSALTPWGGSTHARPTRPRPPGSSGVLSHTPAGARKADWYVGHTPASGGRHGTLWRQSGHTAEAVQCTGDQSYACWGQHTASLSYWQETGELWTLTGAAPDTTPERVLYAVPLTAVNKSLARDPGGTRSSPRGAPQGVFEARELRDQPPTGPRPNDSGGRASGAQPRPEGRGPADQPPPARSRETGGGSGAEHPGRGRVGAAGANTTWPTLERGAAPWFPGPHEQRHCDHLVPGESASSDLLPAITPDGDVRIVRSEVPSPEFNRSPRLRGRRHPVDRPPELDVRAVAGGSGPPRRGDLGRLRPGNARRLCRAGPAGRRRRRGHVLRTDPRLPGPPDRRAPALVRGGASLGPGGALAGAARDEAGLAADTSKDGEHAMDNYLRRGFKLFDTKVEEEPEIATPGPWPGARAV